ncbi:MAG: hypothetical protein RL660_2627 [Bacteroidota bacterium]|jgi:hypothetical protein
MKKFLSIAIILSIFSTSHAQQLITASSMTYAQLTPDQQNYYDSYAEDSTDIADIMFVEVGNPFDLQTSSGVVTLNLPAIGAVNETFKTANARMPKDGEYFWYGLATEAAHNGDFVTITTKNANSAMTLLVDDEVYQVSTLGNGVHIMYKLLDAPEGATICPNITSQADPDTDPPSLVDPCSRSLSKLLVVVDQDLIDDYGLAAVELTALQAIDQCNTTRGNSKVGLAAGALDNIVFVGLLVDNTLPNSNADIGQDNTALAGLVVNPSTTIGAARVNLEADIVVGFFSKTYTDQNTNNRVYGIAGDFLNPLLPTAMVSYLHATDGKKLTFTHEVHHLYGAKHVVDFNGPAYAHAKQLLSHGFIGTHLHGTVVHEDARAWHVMCLSNPNITQSVHGFPNRVFGTVNAAENARYVAENEHTVAEYIIDAPGQTPVLHLSVDQIMECDMAFEASAEIFCGEGPYTYTWYYGDNPSNLTLVANTNSTPNSTNSVSHTMSPFNATAAGIVVCMAQDASGYFMYGWQWINTNCVTEQWTSSNIGKNRIANAEADLKGRPSVFPNPVLDGKLTITMPPALYEINDMNKFVDISISDIQGNNLFAKQIVRQHQNNDIIIELPKSILPGLYFVTISINNNKYVQKISVQ